MKTYEYGKGIRQHGIAALLSSLKVLKEMLIPLLVLFISHGFRSGEGKAFYWRLAIGGGLLLIAALWGVMQWWFMRYRVEEGQLRVDQGVLIKKKQSIPIERIQTVDFSEGLLHRLFGLVRVQVQTAGGTKPEAVFTAVTKAEAARLESLLRPGASIPATAQVVAAPMEEAAPGQQELVPEEVGEVRSPPELIGRLSADRLLLAGLTANNLGVGISILFAIASQIDDLFPNFEIFRFLANASGPRIVLILLSIAFVLSWLMAVGSSILRFSGFTIMKQDEELIITRGLLERQKVTLPVRRIQAVRIVQEMIWKPFGLVAVHVVCAGYGNRKGESTLLFPLIAMKEVEPLLRRVCPEYAVDPSEVPFQAPARRAVWSYMVPIPLLLVMASLGVYFIWSWAIWGLLLVLPAIGLCWYSYKRAGYCCEEGSPLIVVRSRWVTQTVAVIPKKRIQYFSVKQNLLQRRRGMSAFKISVASTVFGAHFGVKGLPIEESLKLMAWSRRTDLRRGLPEDEGANRGWLSSTSENVPNVMES